MARIKTVDYRANYTRNVTSQKGEDGLIEYIFSLVKPSTQFCVEFGAWDGKLFSNTWNLVNNKGWRGVMIEADKPKFSELVKTYNDNQNITCLHRLVDFRGRNRLDKLLASTETPQNFDLLSIDIDGNDYHVWSALQDYYPKVVVIEFNPAIPPEVEYVQPADHQVSQGSSLLALTRLAKSKGYELVGTTSWNAFFVKRRYLHLFGLTDNTPRTLMTDTSYISYYFQLFDGTIGLTGCDRTIWHNYKIHQKNIQEVPRLLRTSPSRMSSAQKIFFKFYRICRFIFADPNLYDFFWRALRFLIRKVRKNLAK